MKKTCSVLLAVIVAAFLLTGCGGGAPEESASSGDSSSSYTSEESLTADTQKVELTYWQHSSEARNAMITELVKKFQEENPNITVHLEFIPEDDYTEKLIPALATDSAPDVFQVQSGMVTRLAKVGSIQPLDEAIMPTASIESDFIASTIDGLKYGGKYYGVPTDTQSILLYWNKDLLKAEGLDSEKGPQTWEEMFEYARKLTKTNNGQMVQSGWGHKGYFPEVTSIVEQYAGKFYDSQSGKYVFADDETAVKAITDISNVIRVDKVYDENFMANWAGFREGKVAMMLGHPAMIGNLATTAPDINYGIGLIPAADTGSRSSCVTSWGYVMSKNAESEAATKLIDYLGSEEVEKQWTLITGELPARKALLDDAELKADSKISIALESLNESFVGSLQTGALNTIWNDAYEKIMVTDESLETILKDCQDKLNEEIAKDIE